MPGARGQPSLEAASLRLLSALSDHSLHFTSHLTLARGPCAFVRGSPSPDSLFPRVSGLPSRHFTRIASPLTYFVSEYRDVAAEVQSGSSGSAYMPLRELPCVLGGDLARIPHVFVRVLAHYSYKYRSPWTCRRLGPQIVYSSLVLIPLCTGGPFLQLLQVPTSPLHIFLLVLAIFLANVWGARRKTTWKVQKMPCAHSSLICPASSLLQADAKKRSFRKFTYRGVDLDQLLEMKTDELVQLFPCRIRRKVRRSPCCCPLPSTPCGKTEGPAHMANLATFPGLCGRFCHWLPFMAWDGWMPPSLGPPGEPQTPLLLSTCSSSAA